MISFCKRQSSSVCVCDTWKKEDNLMFRWSVILSLVRTTEPLIYRVDSGKTKIDRGHLSSLARQPAGWLKDDSINRRNMCFSGRNRSSSPGVIHDVPKSDLPLISEWKSRSIVECIRHRRLMILPSIPNVFWRPSTAKENEFLHICFNGPSVKNKSSLDEYLFEEFS